MSNDSLDTFAAKIQLWAEDKGIHNAEPSKQMLKVVEEVGEVAAALARGNMDDLQDGIGDVFVTIVILAMQNGLDFDDCVEKAWTEISGRTGKTVGGVFIKD